MNYIIFVFLKLFLIINLIAKDNREYRFNWYPKINVEEDIIKFPDSSKFEIYNTSGVWEDSFGNYGLMRCLVSQYIDKNKNITLDGYCEARDYNEQKFWLSLKRKSFNEAGIGKSKFLFTHPKYEILKSKECPYAAQIIEGGGIFKLKCRITVKEYEIFEKKR